MEKGGKTQMALGKSIATSSHKRADLWLESGSYQGNPR